MIREGKAAPDFTGTTDEGEQLTLGDCLKRGPLVLYFYPADFTPG
jgi:peroxiredoxin Q/BCP